MSPKSNILCIFEGEKRESQYFKTLKSIYLDEKNILVCSFGNDIFELYKELKDDEDLDIVEILRESKDVSRNKDILNNYTRDDFNQVFLFFDFECQDTGFTVDSFLSILDIFNEETENGKVFISYPMIEAIRDIPSYTEFLEHKVSVANCRGKIYKGLSVQGLKLFNDPRYNDKSNWDRLVKITIEKANFILLGEPNCFKMPEQKEIAIGQCKSMNTEGEIFVLSPYPLFIFHQKESTFDFNNET
ncbi:hypothetical protein [Endozoicomonas sp. 4G]|uniref:hypothetical protein n=1 Tax=Endozoicomonas sp. 4G TaxID=2872754 RepID=UPI00207893B5|nr:hypothetical protein [Endozoicomonas sp. 4G]